MRQLLSRNYIDVISAFSQFMIKTFVLCTLVYNRLLARSSITLNIHNAPWYSMEA